MSASAQCPRPSVLRYLYTHNPFYAVSCVLMLYAIWAAYSRLGFGPGSTRLMTGVLAGYTLILAVIGVWIVRWGKVWEDARSILLLLLLLFLAVSISADSLFVRAETSRSATFLLLWGFLFSASVSEAVLWGARVELGALYRIPYHLLLALFYVAPWWYSPELHPRSEESLDWMLLLFPLAASVLLLSLWPAVRGGARYVAQNGTPWSWPLFPGTAFGVIAGAVGLRSYALAMTFGLDGSIWKKYPGGRSIVFDTIWGPYFLVPLALAILVLLLEVGLVSGNRRVVRRVTSFAPLMLLLAGPWSDGKVFREFFQVFVSTIGSPLWWTCWILLAFYLWAWLRGVRLAAQLGLAAGALLVVVGPRTVDLDTLVQPRPWPLFMVGAILLAHGIRIRSSIGCTAAALVAAFGFWWLIPTTPIVEWRTLICLHLLWIALLVVGVSFADPFARLLRGAGAALFPAGTFFAVSESAERIPREWIYSYIAGLIVACLAITLWRRSRWFLYGFGGMTAVIMYAGVVTGFRRATGLLGREATTAFTWSLGTLLLAFLISAQKAHWLPRRIFPWLSNGNGKGMTLAVEPPKPVNGLSPDATP
jgi:hypothetical protein